METRNQAMSDPITTTTNPAVHPVTIEVKVRLQALAIPEAKGGYSIIVPALPGCYSQAETIEEASANVIEAAEGWLATVHDLDKDEAVRMTIE
jgi:predicted RNase H-like HicB family nuclease